MFVPKLSKAQLETIELLSYGKTKIEIAMIKRRKYETIVKRVRVCRELTDTVNTAALVAYCLRNKLIE